MSYIGLTISTRLPHVLNSGPHRTRSSNNSLPISYLSRNVPTPEPKRVQECNATVLKIPPVSPHTMLYSTCRPALSNHNPVYSCRFEDARPSAVNVAIPNELLDTPELIHNNSPDPDTNSPPLREVSILLNYANKDPKLVTNPRVLVPTISDSHQDDHNPNFNSSHQPLSLSYFEPLNEVSEESGYQDQLPDIPFDSNFGSLGSELCLSKDYYEIDQLARSVFEDDSDEESVSFPRSPSHIPSITLSLASDSGQRCRRSHVADRNFLSVPYQTW